MILKIINSYTLQIRMAIVLDRLLQNVNFPNFFVEKIIYSVTACRQQIAGKLNAIAPSFAGTGIDNSHPDS